MVRSFTSGSATRAVVPTPEPQKLRKKKTFLCSPAELDELVAIAGSLKTEIDRRRLILELHSAHRKFDIHLALDFTRMRATRARQLERATKKLEQGIETIAPGAISKALGASAIRKAHLVSLLNETEGTEDAHALAGRGKVIELIRQTIELIMLARAAAERCGMPPDYFTSDVAEICGSEPEARAWLSGIELPRIFERYFGPFTLTRRTDGTGGARGRGLDFVALQTADIARRLMRGGELHQEAGPA